MTKIKQEKWMEYAYILTEAISDVLENEDNINYIDKNEFLEDDNATEFFHALATVMPAQIYNTLSTAKTDSLGFNHIANRLCFQFSKTDKDSKKGSATQSQN
jgi:hypothetical protein